MGILRRKKDESGKSLLDSNKRGFLSFRKSSVDRRSDNPGETKLGLSSAPHWGKVRSPATPPLTPRSPVEDNEIPRNAPVADVTLVKGRSKIKEGDSPKKNSKMPVSDDHSEYSDLTDNRTQQRLIEQKAVYERILEERKNREKALFDTPPRSGSGGSSLPSKDKSMQHRTNAPPKENDEPSAESNFFTDLFGLMDIACKPSEPKRDEFDNKSFAPEWGVAPTYDDSEFGQRPPKQPSTTKSSNASNNSQLDPSTAVSGASLVDTVSDTADTPAEAATAIEVDGSESNDNDDMYTDGDQSHPSSRYDRSIPHSPKSTHENFEMVLEELQEEEFSPKRRSWMKNPFNRKKAEQETVNQRNDTVDVATEHREITIAPDKKHQAMIKQALFPDYDSPANEQADSTTRDVPRVLETYQPTSIVAPDQVHSHDQTQGIEIPPPKEQSYGSYKDKRGSASADRQDSDDGEEKKEEAPDPGLELPDTSSASTGRTKQRPGKRIFASFRRRTKQKSVATLEPVQEGKPSTPTSEVENSNVSRPNPLKAARKSLRRNRSRTSADGSRSSGESDNSSGSRSQEKPNDNNGVQDSAEEGRLTPLVEVADTKDHGDDEDPGFVGGFMAMISETVAAVQAGQPVPEEVANIPEKSQSNIPQSKTWKEDNDEELGSPNVDSPPDLRRSKSAPQKVGDKQFKRRKQVWKEVKDPNSGRSYYYHRITRQTTWTRPKELDAIQEEEEIRPSSGEAEPATGNESNIRNKSAEEKLQQLRQSRASTDDNDTGKESVRKTSARDFDPDVWNQKQKIVELLQSMAPPDGTSIDSLMAQYEGRENELLAHVRRMKDSRPFDEPLGAESEGLQGGGESTVQGVNDSMRTRDSHNSFPRTTSGITSRQSESTQLIKNTKRSPRRREESTVGGTTLSSSYAMGPQPHENQPHPVQRIPSKIPAPRVRTRELMVEEFSNERFKSETFNNDLGKEPAPVRHRPFTTPYGQSTIEEEEELNDADSSHANDTVSALSVNEMEFVHPSSSPEGSDDSKRRALDEAIRREDWDMAALISERMRGGKNKDGGRSRNKSGEWKQSELDKFISESDWEAVSEYIARLRSKSRAEYSGTRGTSDSRRSSQRKGKYSEMISSGKPPSSSSKSRRSSGYMDDESNRGSSMKKRFGARSQLQHTSIGSVDRSSSSEVSESDESAFFSSESSSSAPPRHQRYDRRRPSGMHSKPSGRKGQSRY